MDHQNYFPVRDKYNRVTLEPVSKACYEELMREVWRTRSYMKYHRRCCQPRKLWWLCDGQCDLCRFCCGDPCLSLELMEEESGHDFPSCCDVETAVTDQLVCACVLRRLRELAPDVVRAGELRLQGCSLGDAAKQVGVSHQLLRYHMKRALRIMREEGLLEDLPFSLDHLLSHAA